MSAAGNPTSSLPSSATYEARLNEVAGPNAQLDIEEETSQVRSRLEEFALDRASLQREVSTLQQHQQQSSSASPTDFLLNNNNNLEENAPFFRPSSAEGSSSETPRRRGSLLPASPPPTVTRTTPPLNNSNNNNSGSSSLLKNKFPPPVAFRTQRSDSEEEEDEATTPARRSSALQLGRNSDHHLDSSKSTKPIPEFQRIIVTGKNLADEEGDRETRIVCRELREALALRAKYHVPCKPTPYYGSFEPVAYETAQLVQEKQHEKVWGSGRRGRAAPIFQAAFPDSPQPVVRKNVGEPGGGYRVRRNRSESALCDGDVKSNNLEMTTTTTRTTTTGENGATEEEENKLVEYVEEGKFELVEGVYRVQIRELSPSSDPSASPAPWRDQIPNLPSVREFFADLNRLNEIHLSGPTKTVCFKRLELLDARFNLHRLLNARVEHQEQRRVPHRDFYNVRKVDGHIHHSAIMTQKHLLRFMKHKLKRCPDEVVTQRDGKHLTLREVFESLGLTAYDLSIDFLDMHADDRTFHRFDRFNLKYNPVGETRLREVFLKTANLIQGRYLAEITKQVFNDLEENKYVLVEPRLSIYGKDRGEWKGLGQWYADNRLASPQVRWMIQIPRLYSVYKGMGAISSFQDLLDNIFLPLFEATLKPEENPALDCFLNLVVGLDCVDDESRVDSRLFDETRLPTPSEWTFREDPPYSYWIYYLWANLRELNALRMARGMTTFSMRPHSGEIGDLNHLAAAFLCAESINHGIMLRKSPSLQYLYYLASIGLAMSPLSNNRLFLDYHNNPFPIFFARGLNVALSTDDPLLLHVTKDPLVEEYSVAAQVWKLSSTDVCEIAKNSVLMSGLEHPFKSHFVGENYFLPSVQGNDIHCTNVPDIRVQYRYETHQEELRFVREGV